MSTDARGYVNARDNLSAYAQMREDLREREDLYRALADAQDALDEWEMRHEREYKHLFELGERGELNRLDAEWNVLVAERDAARELTDAWSL